MALEAYNVDKVRQLHQAGKVSRIELLTAESSHALADSRVKVLRERYERAGIKAPFDGVLVDRYVEAGMHSHLWEASNLSSGVYFYRLKSKGFSETKKLVLLK